MYGKQTLSVFSPPSLGVRSNPSNPPPPPPTSYAPDCAMSAMTFGIPGREIVFAQRMLVREEIAFGRWEVGIFATFAQSITFESII